MKWKIVDLQTCLNLISAIILLVGLGSAIWIYRTAENNSSGVLGYEEEGGTVYPIMPGESKKYLRDMELYGGKALMLLRMSSGVGLSGYGMENHWHTQSPALPFLYLLGFSMLPITCHPA